MNTEDNDLVAIGTVSRLLSEDCDCLLMRIGPSNLDAILPKISDIILNSGATTRHGRVARCYLPGVRKPSCGATFPKASVSNLCIW